MRVFIVHAHPEPRSFSGAMTQAASEALAGAGHEVAVSDLYAMRFDPVSDRRNFVTTHDPDYYRQQAEQGLNGPIAAILFPINHGMLYFTGFTVIEPFLVHAPVRIGEERKRHLERYRERVLGLETAPTIAYPKLDDYDERFVLRVAAS